MFRHLPERGLASKTNPSLSGGFTRKEKPFTQSGKRMERIQQESGKRSRRKLPDEKKY